MIVVAKLYVSAVSKTGNPSDLGVHTHVSMNCVYSPDPTTDNHSFWKASPNGTMKLVFPPDHDVPEAFEPGQMFKVYHQRDADGGWRLSQCTQDGKRLTICLRNYASEDWYKHVHGEENMDIDNQEVFGFYVGQTDPVYSLLFEPVDRDGAPVGEAFKV